MERLAALLRDSPEVRDFIEDNVHRFNGTPGDPASFDLLDALLDDQAYRLAYWRVAAEEINYRRFFAVTHRLILRLVGEGLVTGLRIDHPDGLYAPAEYFHRLRQAAGPDLYIVAEKILAPGERLPEAWEVAGTTGYEFLNLLNGIFVDRGQARALEDLAKRHRREPASFAEIVYQAKRAVMETTMESEIAMLARRLGRISEQHRSTRDFTLGRLTQALREIIACFPVYRTYVGDWPTRESSGAWPAAGEPDAEYIARAVALAKRRAAAVDVSIYDWIQDLLTLRIPPWATEANRRQRLDWVMRFQQVTGPITAKGYEDTALYRYHRLLSLNEVGGDPARFGTPLNEFHAAMVARQREQPHGLSATSTHDTKRGEDVRARINVLSEIPLDWRRRLARWHRLNRRHRTVVDGQPVPGPEEEYFLYQTLVGAWPLGVDRLRAYLTKALREAKLRTSWVTPNPRYEEAMLGFAEALLDHRRAREFLRDFLDFQPRVARYGALNSLGQVLVKITAPGIPDFYPGSEIWDLSLVDPDNRRSVDFERRRRTLEALPEAAQATSGLARELAQSLQDGRAKMYVMRQGLHCRRARATLFQDGSYRPLEATGPLAEHVCAFARARGEETAITVVPRLLARRQAPLPPLGAEAWGEGTGVVAPPDLGGHFRNVMTGERVDADEGVLPLDRVFADFPVALLLREAGAAGAGEA